MLTAAMFLISIGGLGLAWALWFASTRADSSEGGFGVGMCGLIWLGTACTFANYLLQKM